MIPPRLARLTALLITAPLLAQSVATIHLRGGEASLSGEVESAGLESLTLSTGSVRRIIGWDWVRDVEGYPLDAAILERAETLWRARTRVQRGDYALAERSLENLSLEFGGLTGPTAAAIFEGLLRCRLNRAAYAQSIPVALCLSGAAPLGRTSWFTPSTPPREPLPDEVSDAMIWDPHLELCPLLPPLWVDTPATRALDRQPWPENPPRTAALSLLYRSSLNRELGLKTLFPETPSSDLGLRLVSDIVAAQAVDPALRRDARTALRARLTQEHPPWVISWCHAALGRSLILEPAAEDVLQGLADLLRVPALDPHANPNLTAFCLAHAAVTLHRLDDAPAAGALKQELLDLFPLHPVLNWEALAKIPSYTPLPLVTTPDPSAIPDNHPAGGPP